jgi:hypothetical protein
VGKTSLIVFVCLLFVKALVLFSSSVCFWFLVFSVYFLNLKTKKKKEKRKEKKTQRSL